MTDPIKKLEQELDNLKQRYNVADTNEQHAKDYEYRLRGRLIRERKNLDEAVEYQRARDEVERATKVREGIQSAIEQAEEEIDATRIAQRESAMAAIRQEAADLIAQLNANNKKFAKLTPEREKLAAERAELNAVLDGLRGRARVALDPSQQQEQLWQEYEAIKAREMAETPPDRAYALGDWAERRRLATVALRDRLEDEIAEAVPEVGQPDNPWGLPGDVRDALAGVTEFVKDPVKAHREATAIPVGQYMHGDAYDSAVLRYKRAQAAVAALTGAGSVDAIPPVPAEVAPEPTPSFADFEAMDPKDIIFLNKTAAQVWYRDHGLEWPSDPFQQPRWRMGQDGPANFDIHAKQRAEENRLRYGEDGPPPRRIDLDNVDDVVLH